MGLLMAHKFAAALTGWLLFSAVVDGMPKPDAGSSKAYRWAHASLNLLAGNLFRVLCAVLPRFGNMLGNAPEPRTNDE